MGVLVGAVIIGTTFNPGGGSDITVRHIPQTIPVYSGFIGEFSPMASAQITFNDFAAIRAVNSSAVTESTYLRFAAPALNISSVTILQRLSVVLSQPNATVDVTELDQAAFNAAWMLFSASTLPKTHVGSFVLYNPAEVSSPQPKSVWIAMAPSSSVLIASEGALPAFTAVSQVLAVYSNTAPSLLTSPEVRRMLYVVNGTSGHLALAIQNFPGAAASGQSTLITVDKLQSDLAVNYAVSFSDPDVAQAQLAYFRTVYLGSRAFASYDEILLATQSQPTSALLLAVALAG